MTDELELLRGVAGEHGRCLDIMADARRAKVGGDKDRHGLLIRQLRIAMEQRDALHTLWRRSYAGHATSAVPIDETPVVLPIRAAAVPAA